MIGLDSYSRHVFIYLDPILIYISLWIDCLFEIRKIAMFPLAFIAGWSQGHWWGCISRNYVVWPTFLLMNVFIALTGSHFWFLSVGYGLVVNIQKHACFSLGLTLWTIFKICSQFLENATFEKIIKILFLQECQLFECFSVMCTKLFTYTQHTYWKFGLRIFFLENLFFLKKFVLHLLPPKLSITK